MDEHVFLTGADSALGRAVTADLLKTRPEARLSLLFWKEEKDRGKAFAAELENRFALPDGQVQSFYGDVADATLGLKESVYEELRQGITHSLHLAGSAAENGDRDQMIAVNVYGSENVVYFAGHAQHLRLHLHISPIGIGGLGTGEFAPLEAEHQRPFRSLDLRTRYEAELSVRTMIGKMPLAIVRLGTVLGSGFLQRLQKTVRWSAKLPGQPGFGDDTPMHVVTPAAAAPILTAVLFADNAAGQTVHVVDAHPGSGSELFREAAKVCDRTVPQKSLTLTAWKALAVAPWLGRGIALSTNELGLFYQGTGSAAPNYQALLPQLPPLPDGRRALAEALLTIQKS